MFDDLMIAPDDAFLIVDVQHDFGPGRALAQEDSPVEEERRNRVSCINHEADGMPRKGKRSFVLVFG